MDLFLIIIWAASGVITLCLDKIPKATYAITWLTLMMYIAVNHMGG